MVKFFDTEEIQQSIKNKIHEIESFQNIDVSDFIKERNTLLLQALQSLNKDPQVWDERATFNIEMISNVFRHALSSPVSEANLNLLFTCCFRLFMERFIFDKIDISPLAEAIKNFAIYRQGEFDERSSEQITYTLKEMPLSLLRDLLSSDKIKSYKEYIDRVDKFEDASKYWGNVLRENLQKSEQLNATLIEQLEKFNFVGLYKGFAELGEKKEGELWWAKLWVFTLGGIIPLPLVIETFFMLTTNLSTFNWADLIRLIPSLSLTLILIYFFKVALQNFNSIKAQLIQIDLRKSLCQFIQNYASYAKDIRENNADLLVKFEEIIFSNIMPSEDKIPSTFDGIEQITNLIGAFKKGD